MGFKIIQGRNITVLDKQKNVFKPEEIFQMFEEFKKLNLYQNLLKK